jgi:hypothetical protein
MATEGSMHSTDRPEIDLHSDAYVALRESFEAFLLFGD